MSTPKPLVKNPPAASAEKPGLTIPKWLWDSSKRPDHSAEGFHNAIQVALAHVSQYDWANIDELCEQIACDIAKELRSGGIHVDYTATHKATGKPKIVVRTDWGRRADLDVGVSFTARPPAKKAN